VPDGAMIKLTEIDDYRPEEILILTTGSQGEPLSALTRMAFDDHPQVELNEGDTVVISATPIPGNELSVGNTINRLLKVGATVISGPDSGVHVSGHGSQEDLRMMLNLTRPRFFLPVHGEYRHQHIHRGLARESGIAEEDIFILENGDVLEIDHEDAEIVDKVPTGMVFVDGFEIGDEEGLVLRDRQQLAGDGILIAVITLDAQSGEVVAEPELVARAFLHDDERLKDILDECTVALDKLLDELGADRVTDQKLIREDVNQRLSELVFQRTRRRPLIMPVVVEV
jgi:ribonuclease J